jgi:CarboxypepD_reg-like domain
MKISFLLILQLFITATIFSQSNFTIKGKVINELNGLPLQAASVFAQNTSIGTVTDTEGNFVIVLPNGGYDLVVSYTGFVNELKRISSSDATENHLIKLKEKQKELETVSIVSSNEVKDGMAKYGDFFKAEFIGKTTNAKLCSIQNPDVLHFYFSKKKNRLKITASEPLLIKNEALGYNIKYALDSFTHEYNNEISVYSGYPLYENLQADSAQMQRWQIARAEAYQGSMLHFMRAVYNKTLDQDKFELQFLLKNNGKEDAIKLKDFYAAINYAKDDSTKTVEILPNQNDVGVLFLNATPAANYLLENAGEPSAFQFSILNFKQKESIIIEQNGYFYDQNDVTINGYWAWNKVAEQLPYDYYVETK